MVIVALYYHDKLAVMQQGIMFAQAFVLLLIVLWCFRCSNYFTGIKTAA